MSVALLRYLSIAQFATSFGFGPVSKAVAVANQIRRIEPEAYPAYFGSGSEFEFAKTADVFDEVVAINVVRPANLPALVRRLSGFLLRPAGMESFRLEPGLADGARKIASRVVALASVNSPRGTGDVGNSPLQSSLSP
jgi:hypothetical protein